MVSGFDGANASEGLSMTTSEATEYSFFVPGNPVPKGRPRTVRLPQNGNIVTFTPKRTTTYEATIRAHALRARRLAGIPEPRGTDRFHVDMCFLLEDERPKDGDNLVKTVLDGLQPVAFPNDWQVASHFAERRLACGSKAGVRITIGLIAERFGAP